MAGFSSPSAVRRGVRQLAATRARHLLPMIGALAADRDAHAARADALNHELADVRAQLDAARSAVAEAAQQPAGFRWPEGHPHSTIPDIHDVLARRELGVSPTADVAPGVDMRPAAQIELARELGPLMADLPWDLPGDNRYSYDNTSFGASDALLLTALLRHRRPARLVEIGGGYATAAVLDVRDRWLPDLEVVVVEPDPRQLTSLLRESDPVTLFAEPLQDAVDEVLKRVRPGDVLFIDSSHVVKAGSDAQAIYGELLPRLPPDVLVHVHGVYADFDYPSPWLDDGRFWNESYILRAYLSGNAAVRVVFASDWLQTRHRDQLAALLPRLVDGDGASFWFETTAQLAPSAVSGPVAPAHEHEPAAYDDKIAPTEPATEVPTPVRLIEWDGERCVPWTDDLQVVYEHYHRYLMAAGILDAAGGPRTLLDLASGEGYGSDLLASRGHKVTGIELSPVAVRHASQKYARRGLAFRRGTMLDLSAFADGSVGAITCYEALEHVVEHDTLLAEIARVLSDDGLLFISSPDRTVYSEAHDYHNPFHLRELDESELRELLGKHFPNVALWGQTVAVGSVAVPYSDPPRPGPGEMLTLAVQPNDRWAAVSPVRATYLLAVASRAALPTLPSVSTMVDAGFTLVTRTIQERDAARAS